MRIELYIFEVQNRRNLFKSYNSKEIYDLVYVFETNILFIFYVVSFVYSLI